MPWLPTVTRRSRREVTSTIPSRSSWSGYSAKFARCSKGRAPSNAQIPITDEWESDLATGAERKHETPFVHNRNRYGYRCGCAGETGDSAGYPRAEDG